MNKKNTNVYLYLCITHAHVDNAGHLESNEYAVKVEELWGGHECNSGPLALCTLLLHLKNNLGSLHIEYVTQFLGNT